MQYTVFNFKQQKRLSQMTEPSFVWRFPSLPGGCPPSTIGVIRLNFCVRYGNRCIPYAIITIFLNLLNQQKIFPVKI